MIERGILKAVSAVFLIAFVIGLCFIPPATAAGSVHFEEYEIMVLDGIDQELITRAIAFVPNYWGFTITDPDPGRYYIDKYNNVRPNEDQDHLIIFYDNVKRRATEPNGGTSKIVGHCSAPSRRIWIAIMPDRVNDMAVGRNLWHELDHTLAPAGAYSVSGFPNIDLINGRSWSVGSAYSYWYTHNGGEIFNKLMYPIAWWFKQQSPAYGGFN